jgi:uncharacterized protein YndB with AHSA1/START domain
MNTITIKTTISATQEKVWKYWTIPEHIRAWAFASDDWKCPHAENDVQVGGTFLSRMQAKDRSTGFDFGGTYTEVTPLEYIAYTMEDGRKVTITFEKVGENETKVIETFDPEDTNPLEMQQSGWQSILDNFKKHVESN